VCYASRWRQSTGSYVFSILLLLYILQVGSLIIWFTDTGQSLSAEVWSSCLTLFFMGEMMPVRLIVATVLR